MHFDPVRKTTGEIRRKLAIPDPRHSSLSKVWSTDTEIFLVQLYLEALGDASQPDKWAFCVAGSLARKDAAPFSDIDCFVLLGDASDTQRMKKVGPAFREKLMATMTQDVAMMLDPVGIEPTSLCDTPANISKMIVADSRDHLIHPLRNARVVLGETQLLTDLWELLDASNAVKAQGFGDLKESYVNYPPFKVPSSLTLVAPKEIVVNLKQHLARPLMLCLNGLAKLKGVTSVGAIEQAKDLQAENHLSEAFGTLVAECSTKLGNIRVKSHLKAFGHHGDELKFKTEAEISGELRDVIEGVNCLQHTAKAYIEWTSNNWLTQRLLPSPFQTDPKQYFVSPWSQNVKTIK